MTLVSGGGESDHAACGPPASLTVHLASSAVTPVGSVHKSRGNNVALHLVVEQHHLQIGLHVTFLDPTRYSS